MKLTNSLLVILIVSLLSVVGCGKSNPPPPPASGAVDMAKLEAAFPSPAPLIQNSLNKLKVLIGNARYEPAVDELDKMSRLPGLTGPQKQALKDFGEGLKKAMAAAPKPPA